MAGKSIRGGEYELSVMSSAKFVSQSRLKSLAPQPLSDPPQMTNKIYVGLSKVPWNQSSLLEGSREVLSSQPGRVAAPIRRTIPPNQSPPIATPLLSQEYAVV